MVPILDFVSIDSVIADVEILPVSSSPWKTLVRPAP